MTDARNSDKAILTARPTLRHPYPTGALLVTVRVTVPREMDFHPPMFITEDFFAFRTDDRGNHWTIDLRFGLWLGAPVEMPWN
ncbi:Uncharacterised protein [Vibrio cholerae]|nr:Uncharacterised protein [Vibrio cholerae]CSB54907.1 Uncharacterised protein [Vibrio cholerae]CSB95528.1 Uncharacterised protein [Vibrio cholerae]